MNPELLALGCLAAVVVLLVLRTPIAFALGISATTGIFLFFAWPEGGSFDPAGAIRPTLSLAASRPFEFVSSYPLSMIPLFIALGHVSYHAGITTDIYYAIRIWLWRLPGGVAMASIVGCGGFSAITGSSVACASAMGRIATPEMLRFGYHPSLATASVAAGGTLGSLIPPSLLFVLYAIFTEQSVSALFIAGIVPGVLSLVAYLAVVYVWARRSPSVAPPVPEAPNAADKRRALFGIWPAALLFTIVVGGIYSGIFTPTEAAAASAVTAAIIGLATTRLKGAGLLAALRDTAYQTAMIFAIAVAAKIFTGLMSLTQFAPTVLEVVQGADVPVWMVIGAIVLMYLLLGMFLDPIGILLITLPVAVPLVEGLGLDLIWFGVIVVKLLEIGLITPPIGLNVFVLKGVVGDAAPLDAIFRGVARFLGAEVVVLALLLFVPALSLWLPGTMQ